LEGEVEELHQTIQLHLVAQVVAELDLEAIRQMLTLDQAILEVVAEE
jgi:hypothetical protein